MQNLFFSHIEEKVQLMSLFAIRQQKLLNIILLPTTRSNTNFGQFRIQKIPSLLQMHSKKCLIFMLLMDITGLPQQQVIGLGTVLDTTRLRSLLADRLQVPPTQVSTLILGEHGDSMVPIWSAAQIAGLPLEKFTRDSS